jgi:hypothetical protein
LLFDPFEEYLEPSFQGYRLRQGKYVPIRPWAEGWPAPCWVYNWKEMD